MNKERELFEETLRATMAARGFPADFIQHLLERARHGIAYRDEYTVIAWEVWLRARGYDAEPAEDDEPPKACPCQLYDREEEPDES